MPPCGVWAFLRRWAPAPAPEPWLDLEAAAEQIGVSCDDDMASRVVTKTLFRGFLVSLWVYMIHAMVQFVSDYKDRHRNDDDGLRMAIFLMVAIGTCATPSFLFADQIFDDFTKKA
ncbi:hypothetical protein ACP4OV_015053 [Aristida adscensionis]